MKKVLSMLLVLILALSLVLAGCSSEETSTDTPSSNEGTKTETSGETIKLGVIQPRSGALASGGEPSYWGTKFAIDMFNEAGGVDGTQIEMVFADVPDQAAAQTEVNRLIQQEDCKVITGVYGSALASVAAQICDRNGVIYWEQISVSEGISQQGYETFFRLNLNGRTYGEKGAETLESLLPFIGVENLSDLTYGIVTGNNDGGVAMNNGVVDWITANGLEANVVLNTTYDTNTTDTSPVALQLKDANPDVVLIQSYINDGIDMTKQIKNINWMPKLWVGYGSGYGVADYYEALGEDAEGILDVDPTGAPNLENLDPEMAELVAEFQKRFEAENGYVPPTTAYLAWQATWVLLNDVVKASGGVDDLDTMLNNAKAIDIPVGTLPTGAGVKFREDGENINAVQSVMQWQDGALVTVGPENLRNADPINLPHPNWDER